VAAETVVGGIAGGACATVAGGIAAGASAVSFVSGALAKAGGANVSNTDLALSAVGAIPGVGAIGRVARAAEDVEEGARAVLGATQVEKAASSLFHYTKEEGMQGIVKSGKLLPSLKSLNPNDARYGNGQYLSDITPGSKTPAQLSRLFINNPFQGARFTHYVEIDVSGLNVVQGRPGVFVIQNEDPLNLAGRLIGWGPN
jgi:large repetitive protein